jgi:hypothetical protein
MTVESGRSGIAKHDMLHLLAGPLTRRRIFVNSQDDMSCLQGIRGERVVPEMEIFAGDGRERQETSRKKLIVFARHFDICNGPVPGGISGTAKPAAPRLTTAAGRVHWGGGIGRTSCPWAPWPFILVAECEGGSLRITSTNSRGRPCQSNAESRCAGWPGSPPRWAAGGQNAEARRFSGLSGW